MTWTAASSSLWRDESASAFAGWEIAGGGLICVPYQLVGMTSSEPRARRAQRLSCWWRATLCGKVARNKRSTHAPSQACISRRAQQVPALSARTVQEGDEAIANLGPRHA